MIDIKYDKYSGKWWVEVKDQHTALSFEQLEAFAEKLNGVISEEYAKQLQAELFDEDCDGCKI